MASVVEQVIDADAKEVVLNIPRFSRLADSLANFHLLKREAGLLKKKIIIESVDDKVIDLAGVAGMDSWNPILSRAKRQFSDIVSTRQTKEGADEDNILKRKLVESVGRKPSKIRRPANLKKRFLALGIFVVSLSAIFMVANSVLPRAAIHLTRAASDWDYSGTVVAQKLAQVDSRTATVPGQVFIEKPVLQASYPASGKRAVQQKAVGKVTIYNAYSSDPQPLVATTRLLTPDGKIFRIVKSVVVPGAKIVEGNIIPSTLVTDVIADQAGAEYNVGPVSHFTIPGLKGTPKYSAFYADSAAAMTGGFVGTVAYPTDGDLTKAKSDMTGKLEEAAKQRIASRIPSEFKIIDGSSKFVVLKHSVITESSAAEGMFTLSSEGQISAVAFREIDVVAMLAGKLERDKGTDYEVKTAAIAYGAGRADLTAGKISFPVTYKASIVRKVNAEALKTNIRGKSEKDLRDLLFSIPALETTKIDLWPFWVNSVPTNEAKITVSVD